MYDNLLGQWLWMKYHTFWQGCAAQWYLFVTDAPPIIQKYEIFTQTTAIESEDVFERVCPSKMKLVKEKHQLTQAVGVHKAGSKDMAGSVSV